VPAEIARRWEALTGHALIEGFGLSETTAPTHINPPHRPKYGTVGVPLPLTEARIVSLEDSATEFGIGKSGEIAVRGPQVMKGYWGNPTATAEALRDGWAEWCRAEMSVYKAPRLIRFVDALPKTATGKILKRVLREKAAEAIR
jgi:acyl-CoA synthetase (AMP-forming)/AMP-acid ligase II